MNLKTIYLTILLFITSCTVDYTIPELRTNEPDRIVVNCYLCPQETVNIYFYKSTKSEKGYITTELTDTKVMLKENETILFDGVCHTSMLKLDYKPKAGYKYSIEVSHKEIKTVKAETRIPNAIKCNAKFTHIGEYWQKSNNFLEANTFDVPKDENYSLWITAYKSNKEEVVTQYNELYTNNALVDNINSTTGMDVMNSIVGSIYYNGFLRVKALNVQYLSSIIFTPSYALNGSKKTDYSPAIKAYMRLISASDEYDKYNRTLYEQKSMIIFMDDISSLFYQPKSVYSNISNGLGIFAGYNLISYEFVLPTEEKH